MARVLADPRDPERIRHELVDMLRRRVFRLVQGYEDLNDHAALRNDVLIQTACERDTALASAPTLCRLENRASRAAAWAIHAVVVEKFIASFKKAPEELVLGSASSPSCATGHGPGSASGARSRALSTWTRATTPATSSPTFEGDARSLYEQSYCARGEMENRIKEAQLGLFADRISSQYFAANQFRLLLSSLAYILTERLRSLALAGTEFARLQASTLRAKLLKIGAVIIRNTRRVRVMSSSAFPYQALYLAAARARLTVAPARALPRHVDKQRGQGGALPKN